MAQTRMGIRMGARNAQKSRRGFTLIEMMVLVIIIAVITSALVPSYSRYRDKAEFNLSVERFLELLSWAREKAIQTNADTVVQFDAQSQSFLVTVEQPDAGTNTDQPAAMQDTQDALAAQQAAQQPRVLSLGQDINIMPSQVASNNSDPSISQGLNAQTLRFRDDGTSSGMQYAMVGRGNTQALIDVNQLTGRATLVQDFQ